MSAGTYKARVPATLQTMPPLQTGQQRSRQWAAYGGLGAFSTSEHYAGDSCAGGASLRSDSSPQVFL